MKLKKNEKRRRRLRIREGRESQPNQGRVMEKGERRRGEEESGVERVHTSQQLLLFEQQALVLLQGLLILLLHILVVRLIITWGSVKEQHIH